MEANHTDSMILNQNCCLDFVRKQKRKRNGILLPKLFWPTVRKKCSPDWKKNLKFKAEGREFAEVLRSLEQFIWFVKGKQFLKQNVPGGFSDLIH